MIKNT
jgi:hypothetical protein